MSNAPRETLDRKINELLDDVLVIESMVRQATTDSVSALMNNDRDLARRVYGGDALINEKRFEIERDCLITIATQQPMAGDLRVLASILETITEIERMGDYAKGIAKITLTTGKQDILPPLHDLPKMAEIATDMLAKATQAFVMRDIDTARSLPKDDDQVDALFNKIYRGLVEHMSLHPETIDIANQFQWAVHNIERMADRVINICERTIFIVTGEMNELEESDDELLTGTA